MMAGLLAAGSQSQPLEPQLVEDVGYWIGEEVEAVRALLAELRKGRR